jgi:hypothetical protein
MQANEMKFVFMLKFDSMFEFGAPAYDDRQISWLLTAAQNRVVKDKYFPLSNNKGLGFEANEMRRRDLEQLIKQAKWTNGVAVPSGSISKLNPQPEEGHPNGIFFTLPEGLLWATEETAKIKVGSGGTPGTEIKVRPVTHDQYIANINNPFKKPYKNLVWRMDYSREQDAEGDLEGSGTQASPQRTELIVPSGYEVHEYRVRYVRTPPAIVVDEFDPTNQKHCVLNTLLHDTIVDEAVKIAKASVKPQEYQISDKEKADGDD